MQNQSSMSQSMSGRVSEGVRNVTSIKVKMILSVVLALLISPAIAIPIDQIVQRFGLVTGNFSAYLTTVINLLLVTTIIMIQLNRVILKPIKDVSANLSILDLKTAVPIKAQDEIGVMTGYVNAFQKKMHGTVVSIQVASDQTYETAGNLKEMSKSSAKATEDIAKTIEEIARGANDQAKNTEEGVRHMMQLAEMISQNQQAMKSLNQAATDVESLKEEGLKILAQVVEKTEANRTASHEVAQVINETNESARQIQSASTMIKSIAEQTNLLALNAAIESARAGEAGRGFAVVAEEIRKLAEQSNRFTEEIGTIICQLTQRTGGAVEVTQNVDKMMEAQAKGIHQTNEKFTGINHSIQRMRKVITDLNFSGNQMETQKDEILGVMENLSAIAEENAAGTQEASASTEEQSATMQQVAGSLDELMEVASLLQNSIKEFDI